MCDPCVLESEAYKNQIPQFPETLKVLPLARPTRLDTHQGESMKGTSPQVSHVMDSSNMEFRARSYQLEMLDQSLKGNVIVAVR